MACYGYGLTGCRLLILFFLFKKNPAGTVPAVESFHGTARRNKMLVAPEDK